MRVCISLLLCLLPLPALASDFAGFWTFSDSEGRFTLSLLEKQGLLCGYASAQNHYRSDGAYLIGRIKGKKAKLEVGTVWTKNQKPTRGPASLQYRNGWLLWEADVGYYPSIAVLEPDTAHKPTEWDADVKAFCDRAWDSLRKGDTVSIDLEYG